MDSKAFVEELEASNQAQLAQWGDVTVLAGEAAQQADVVQLLRIALANEISVSELAAVWMPTTPEWDIKVALAQQAGDEAKHFTLVEARLNKLGVRLDDFTPPAENELFAYLKSLRTSVEKVAAGQFTLESIAYKVNELFMNYCRQLGDEETAQLYEHVIQPEELQHRQMAKRLLEKYATTEQTQQLARAAAAKTLELARGVRQRAAEKLGMHCFPGC
jgi:uncharacterized ferritin-like protein (DUF455 family)